MSIISCFPEGPDASKYLPLAGGTMTGPLTPNLLIGAIDSDVGIRSTKIRIVSEHDYRIMNPDDTTEQTFFKNLLVNICAKYPNDTYTIYIAEVSPNSNGIAIFYIYSNITVDASTGLPQYSSGIYVGRKIDKFGTSSYNFLYSTVS